jgi:hypothetical protein
MHELREEGLDHGSYPGLWSRITSDRVTEFCLQLLHATIKMDDFQDASLENGTCIRPAPSIYQLKNSACSAPLHPVDTTSFAFHFPTPPWHSSLASDRLLRLDLVNSHPSHTFRTWHVDQCFVCRSLRLHPSPHPLSPQRKQTVCHITISKFGLTVYTAGSSLFSLSNLAPNSP